ncbi:glycosyl hydrolase family 18 protein [Thaumasiovibrio subtropicus]|uniref:glycosyl hydrolase family 18 protein n=1 Tax=Thaumasiovibrio subtropicus TaxID=1891207 RepID=UPI000B35778E|nr:glycosyl hydrolase family 18 protein [Thaumasiovibrio subtropicus]
MNTIHRIGSAAMILGLSLSPVAIAVANQLVIDINAPSSPSDWWNNYSIALANSTSEPVELRDAIIEFTLDHEVSSLQWSSTGGVSYPQMHITHSPQNGETLHRVVLSFDEGDWVRTELTAGQSFTLGFGLSGKIDDLTAFQNSIRFTTDGDGGTPVPPPETEVIITSPANGEQRELGEITPIVADIEAQTGETITFSINDNVINTQTALDGLHTYRHAWTPDALGQHTVTVSVLNEAGDSLASEAISLLIIEEEEHPTAPTVSFATPSHNQEFDIAQRIAISVNAADADDDLRSVKVFADNQTICEFDAEQTQDFRCEYQPTTTGSKTLKAEATDATHLTATSQITIKVTEDTGVEPPPIDPPPPGLSCDIKQIYREDGRECMADDKPRRIIGYFTSWRDGANDFPTYLVSDIPWEKITHINYAFAGVDTDTLDLLLSESATDMEWPEIEGAEMDPEFDYTGHFNLLNKYKKQYPDVKTIIALGGWAESGGFFTGTTNADCSVNMEGIRTLAGNAIEAMRKYGFDGIDYDYEYPTSMTNAGNPVDWPHADKCRDALFPNYVELMRVTRDMLTEAEKEDGRRYLFTIASPSSGYLLRGMENFQVTDYLDFINIMTYDFHGTWNHYVAHNAALFDNKEDPELKAAGIYDQAQWGGVGYLNAAWGAAYFRGAVDPSKINVGVPYYTRGWQNVSGGEHGLNGTAPLPNQTQCPEGTGMNDPCGDGARGIDNLWHDLDDNNQEIASGVVPMWHAKNLEHAASLGLAGSMPSYGEAWGLDKDNPDHLITGTYERHFDDKARVPWLWNAEKQVFLSTEDEESIQHKLDFIKDGGFGGVMIWELAGDYAFNAETGEYYMGDTLTSLMYEELRTADDMDIDHNDLPLPVGHIDVDVSVSDFPIGDNNYPINPTLRVVNNSSQSLPTGTKMQFQIASSTSDTISDWNGAGTTVVKSAGHDNFHGDKPNSNIEYQHTVEVTLNPYADIAPGGEVDLSMVFYIPATIGTEGVRLLSADADGNVVTVGLKKHFADLPEHEFGNNSNPGGPGEPGGECDFDISALPVYDGANTQWPQTDWQGNPSHALKPDLLRHNGFVYQAQWWTNSEPGSDSSWEMYCEIK